MNGLARVFAGSVAKFLLKPSIRYRYLFAVNELLFYNRKEAMLRTCMEYVELAAVKGDYVEFGIWQGKSMIAAYHMSRLFPTLSKMRFYGFDSFQGIPLRSQNEVEAEAFPPGTFRAGLEEVRRNLSDAKVDMDRVVLVPGCYADTLTQETKNKLPLQAAAIVYVDCDIYESTVSVLDFIESYLVDGSVIVFDDWYCFRNRNELGEQKAFREWLEQNRRLEATSYKEFGWDGKSFIINQLSSRQSAKLSPVAAAGSNRGVALRGGSNRGIL